MAYKDFSSPLVGPETHPLPLLTLLADAQGVILSRCLGPADLVPYGGELGAIVRPLDDQAFADWWNDLCQRAASPQAVQEDALLRLNGQAEPISLLLTRIAERDEYLVTCLPQGCHRPEMCSLLQHLNVAAARLETDALLHWVRERVTGLLPTDSFYIALHDPEIDLVELRELLDDGALVQEVQYQRRVDGLIGWVLAQRQSLLIRDLDHEATPVAPIQTGAPVRSILMVPLIAHDRCLGVLSLQAKAPQVYIDGDLRFMEVVASLTALGIDRMRLQREAQSHLVVLQALQEISAQLMTVRTDEQLALAITGVLLRLIQADEVRLYLRPRLTAGLEFAAGLTAEGRTAPRPAPVAGSIVMKLDGQGGIAVLSEPPASSLAVDGLDWPPASVIGMPIQRAGVRYGVVMLLYRQPHLLREDERRTLRLMADQAAITVESLRSSRTLLQRFEEVEALHALAQQVTEQQVSEGMLGMVVETVRDIFHCRACVISMLDEDRQEVVIRAAVGVKQRWRDEVHWKVGEGVAGNVVATGRTIYVPDVHGDPAHLIFDPEVHSVLAVPITFQGRTIGALNLDSTQPDAFSLDHERVLGIAAAQIAAALENARLYQAELERAKVLVATNEELKMQDRLREELIQNLAHELRNPLTYVKGYVGLLQDGVMGEVTEEQQDALRIIADKADMLEHLIADVASLEQISEETLERELLDVNALARQAIEFKPVGADCAPAHLYCRGQRRGISDQRRSPPPDPGHRQLAQQRDQIHPGQRDDHVAHDRQSWRPHSRSGRGRYRDWHRSAAPQPHFRALLPGEGPRAEPDWRLWDRAGDRAARGRSPSGPHPGGERARPGQHLRAHSAAL